MDEGSLAPYFSTLAIEYVEEIEKMAGVSAAAPVIWRIRLESPT